MPVVFDANVIAAIHRESLGHPTTSTASAMEAWESVTSDMWCMIDDEEQIENEWRAVVDREWFEAWLARALQFDLICLVKAESGVNMKKALQAAGFPATSKDFWYVRTALAGVNVSPVYLVTEDLDFFDPKRKRIAKGKARISLLLSSRSPVQRILKKHGIAVRCIQSFLSTVTN